MKNSPHSNVRFVRCPRCREVLPEPTDVPIYRCGRCVATLQAKYYRCGNERRETVLEGPGSGQSNEVEQSARGGETSSSSAQIISSAHCSGQNEGIHQSSAQNGDFEKLGDSRSSREVSSTNQFEQQPCSSSAEHFPELSEERDQNLEVTCTIQEDLSLNKPSPSSHEKPSNLVPETGEVERDHRCVEQHGDWKASSSNKPMEQPAQSSPENGDVRQDEIFVELLEEQLKAADSGSEAASFEATTVKTEKKILSNGEADELNHNVSINCRREQPGVASFPSKVLLSNVPSLYMINNLLRVAAEEGKVEGSSAETKEQLGVSNLTEKPSLPNEPTAGAKELPSQLGSVNEEVAIRDQNFVANPNERQPGSGAKCEREISSTNKLVFTLKRNDSSSQSLKKNQGGESDNAVTSSNESMFPENRVLSQLVTENREMDEGSFQNELGQCKGGEFVDNLPSEIISPAGVNYRKMDEPTSVVRETEKTSGLNLSMKTEVSMAPDEYGNGKSHQTAEADPPAYGNDRVSASPTSETVMQTVKTNPRENMKELQKTAPDGFESAASSKATETAEVANAHLEVGTSYRDLRKSPARNSAYDGSVFSYDGNDDQVAVQIPCENMRRINKAEDPVAEHKRQYFPGRNMACSASAFQPQIGSPQAFSAGESHHSAEQSTPALLSEIKISEVVGMGHYRGNWIRPRTEEFLPRVPLYRSPDIPYESSSHLVHEEFSDHPIHHPPYRYKDTRRQLHKRDLDGRMFAEAGWMAEELYIHPYHETSGEIYRYPRHQMYHGGSEYRPLVHRMAQRPYSREIERNCHHAHGPYSHLHPSDIRWSLQFPPPGVYYHSGWYIPREPFDSYTASPQVFTDSQYYDWIHDTSSEDQRQRGQRMSRLQLRRRNSQPVQHLQPIGVAAPFITCYKCSELLQLPSDFLLFKGIRIHRVKCSACSSVLKFTLEKGCHLVPYASKPNDPPSEDTEKGDLEKKLKSASMSEDNHDYEALHRRSISASVYAGNSQVPNTNMVSLCSSSEAPERQKSKVEGKHMQDKGKSKMVEMHNSTAATSSNIPSHSKVTW